MSSYNINTRYAKALFALAVEKDIFGRVVQDADLLFNTFDQSKELRAVLVSPLVKESKKKDILKELFGNKVSKEVMEFILFVLDKNRIEAIKGIFQRFLELRDAKEGIVNISVTSAVDLEENQKNKIKTKLEEYTKKTARMKFNVDEKIIGGFFVRIGDTVVDATVLHRLQLLKKSFQKTNL